MDALFRMIVRDIFFLQDGRTVLVGPVVGGEEVIIKPGPCDVLLNGRRTATIRIEPEMIPSRANPLDFHEMRAVTTLDSTGLTKDLLLTGECRLEGPMALHGHRHLLGIESPPADFVPDDMTLGPRLPEGWDGDAWVKVGETGYFLRAWNKAKAQFAIGTGSRYEEARRNLLDEIARGGKRVVIKVEEAAQEAAAK